MNRRTCATGSDPDVMQFETLCIDISLELVHKRQRKILKSFSSFSLIRKPHTVRSVLKLSARKQCLVSRGVVPTGIGRLLDIRWGWFLLVAHCSGLSSHRFTNVLPMDARGDGFFDNM